MKKVLIVAALLAISTSAHAFRETPSLDIIAEYGWENTMLLGYVSGYRDAWALSQVEIIRASNGSPDFAKQVYRCAAEVDAKTLLRAAVVTYGELIIPVALQRILDRECWPQITE